MKTTIKRILSLAAIMVLLLSLLSACGGLGTLNGTYQKSDGIFQKSYSFSYNGTVNIMVLGEAIGTSGTYTIKGNQLTITGTFGIVTTHTITRQRNSIIIDGDEYIKIK